MTDRYCCDGRCEQGRGDCPARPVQDFDAGMLRRVHDPAPIFDGWFVLFGAAIVSILAGGMLHLWFM